MAHGLFLLVVATCSLVPWQRGLYKPLSTTGSGFELGHQDTAEVFKRSPAHSNISSSQPTGYWITDQPAGPQKDSLQNIPYIGNWGVVYHIFYLNSVDGRFGKLGLSVSDILDLGGSCRIWGHEWGDLPMIFTSDEVTSEYHRQIASRVTQKSLFMVTNVLLYFLHAIWWPEYTFPLKQLLIDDFATVAKESLFWLSKANLDYWRCDVIFVNCFCTWKLEQRRSSLVNSPREYRFLIILFKSPQITLAVQSF